MTLVECPYKFETSSVLATLQANVLLLIELGSSFISKASTQKQKFLDKLNRNHQRLYVLTVVSCV